MSSQFAMCTSQQAEQLLVEKCGACHSATAPGGQLDLASPDPAARMIYVPSPAQTPCQGQPLIAGAGGDHLLLTRLAASACGAPMPATPLGDADQQCLRTWVASLVSEAP